MKHSFLIIIMLSFVFFAGCKKKEEEIPLPAETQKLLQNGKKVDFQSLQLNTPQNGIIKQPKIPIMNPLITEKLGNALKQHAPPNPLMLANLINHETLSNYLPDTLIEYKALAKEGNTYKAGFVGESYAKRQYVPKNEKQKNFEIQIQDLLVKKNIVKEFHEKRESKNTAQQKVSPITIKDFPAYLLSVKDKQQLFVLIEDRFLVEVNSFDLKVASQKIVEILDLKGLAELSKKQPF